MEVILTYLNFGNPFSSTNREGHFFAVKLVFVIYYVVCFFYLWRFLCRMNGMKKVNLMFVKSVVKPRARICQVV